MGRPPKYKTAEELQKKIDEYFASGLRKIPFPIGKGDAQTIIEIELPTITGLVLHCEFCSRQAFYDYEKKEEFKYTIKKARTRIEQHYEEELLISRNSAGPIFALKNLGWSDKQEIDHTTAGDKITNLNITVDDSQTAETFKKLRNAGKVD